MTRTRCVFLSYTALYARHQSQSQTEDLLEHSDGPSAASQTASFPSLIGCFLFSSPVYKSPSQLLFCIMYFSLRSVSEALMFFRSSPPVNAWAFMLCFLPVDRLRVRFDNLSSCPDAHSLSPHPSTRSASAPKISDDKISHLEFRKSLDGLQRSEDTQHSQRFDGLDVPSFVISVHNDRQCEHNITAAFLDTAWFVFPTLFVHYYIMFNLTLTVCYTLNFTLYKYSICSKRGRLFCFFTPTHCWWSIPQGHHPQTEKNRKKEQVYQQL